MPFLFLFSYLLSESCRGKAMMAYTKPQQRKKVETERLIGEREMRSGLLILDLKNCLWCPRFIG